MSAKTATIIGSTGLIGQHLLSQLLGDKDFATVRILVRRPVPKTDPKMEVKLVDFSDPESVLLALHGSDIVFCAIGTMQKKVKGNRQLYGKIDFDIPVKAARYCKEIGCERFVTVTCVGASSKKKNFYLKLKGHVEDALKLVGLDYVHIMQPSQLLGNRTEKRPMEKIFQFVMKAASPLLAGSLHKYKPIHAGTVAAAMINASKKQEKGFYRYTYDEMSALAIPPALE